MRDCYGKVNQKNQKRKQSNAVHGREITILGGPSIHVGVEWENRRKAWSSRSVFGTIFVCSLTTSHCVCACAAVYSGSDYCWSSCCITSAIVWAHCRMNWYIVGVHLIIKYLHRDTACVDHETVIQHNASAVNGWCVVRRAFSTRKE